MTASSPTAHARVRYLGALMACCVASSCSNDRRFELTLVLRDDLITYPSGPCTVPELGQQGDLCPFDFEEQVWRDEAGRRAVVPARKLMVTYVAQGQGDFECGGRTLENSWAWRADPAPPPESDPFRLELDDGSVLVLLEEEGEEASTLPLTDNCADYSGSWHGVAGDLDGHTGTFWTNNDSAQITMHLVED
jgi:hypothetical protein